ncbi:MAG: GLPGLI family protein [Duncaniella sp.]|nr:GLPGLI family protein [Duncaniella sp.]
MYKIILCVSLILVSTFDVRAQTIVSNKVTIQDNNNNKKLLIDSAVYKVTYIMSIVKDSTQNDVRTEGYGLLVMGNRCSLFTDYYIAQADSVTAEMEAEGIEGFAQASRLLGILKNRVFDNQVAMNYPEAGLLTVQDEGGVRKYRYEEPIPDFGWKLVDEEKEILGFICHKATMSFRGRNYTAWYSEELPFSSGPYLFGGLPGLIFEITDDKNEYNFTLAGFENVNQPFPITITDRNVENVSREDYRKIKKAFNENPELNFKNVPGIEINLTPDDIKRMDSKKRLYNPIEKE